MSIIGHPIVGDDKYDGHVNLPAENMDNKLHLHSRRLILPHPFKRGEKLDVTAPLPPHMRTTWDLLGLNAERYGN